MARENPRESSKIAGLTPAEDAKRFRTPVKANQVYNHIRRGIECGKFRSGERIPTDRDLSEQLKISRPTVNAALKRLAVEKLISRQGNAGSVVIGSPPRRSYTFGAVLFGLAQQHRVESVFSGVLAELTRAAGAVRSSMLLHSSCWVEDASDPMLSNLYREVADEYIERKVSGVFMMPQQILEGEYISRTTEAAENLSAAGIPVVLIDSDVVRYPAHSRFDVVGIDNFSAGYKLAEHFIQFGCRRIDFLADNTRHPTQDARIAGYLRALQNYGIHSEGATVHHGDLFDPGFVLGILRRRSPEAVLVVSDSRAAEVMRIVLEGGIKVPHQLRIGGFDDLPMARHLAVPLTTIRQPAAALGLVAFRVMQQRIEEPDLPPVQSQVSTELLVRASSGIRKTSTAKK